MAEDKRQPVDFVWFFFRLRGRVNRQAFLLGGLLLAVAQGFPLYRFTLVPEGSAEAQSWALLFWALVGVALWSQVALGAKRLHDMNKPAVAAVSLFVPVVSIIAFLVLCLFPGDPGPNAYGRQTNAPQ